jgi:hypothetical protein
LIVSINFSRDIADDLKSEFGGQIFENPVVSKEPLSFKGDGCPLVLPFSDLLLEGCQVRRVIRGVPGVGLGQRLSDPLRNTQHVPCGIVVVGIAHGMNVPHASVDVRLGLFDGVYKP